MRGKLRLRIAIGSAGLLAAAGAARAADPGGVSREDYNRVVRALKRTMERVDKLEKEPRAAAAATGGEVDLSAMDGAAADPGASSRAGASPLGGAAGATPGLKAYFDLNLVARPGITDFSFTNFHNFVLFEYTPAPDLQFSFNLGGMDLLYYELAYQVTPRFQVRLGKVWIPFDEMDPHAVFGGRVNVSTFSPSGDPFLPQIWADLGVAVKYAVVDTQALQLITQAYVVNGIGSGGTSPRLASEPYPSFASTSASGGVLRDNNRDKAVGGRLTLGFHRTFTLGASVYRGRWTDESVANRGLMLLGTDASLRLGRSELRAGLANGAYDLIAGDSVTRGAVYGELSHRLGAREQWKAMLRGGVTQFDNRVTDLPQDVTLVGGAVTWQPGVVQYGLEYHRDLKDAPTKANYEYVAIRVVVSL